MIRTEEKIITQGTHEGALNLIKNLLSQGGMRIKNDGRYIQVKLKGDYHKVTFQNGEIIHIVRKLVKDNYKVVTHDRIFNRSQDLIKHRLIVESDTKPDSGKVADLVHYPSVAYSHYDSEVTLIKGNQYLVKFLTNASCE